MNETDYKSPATNHFDEQWNKLSSLEKALCLNYRNQVFSGNKVKAALMNEINAIHEKHEDFHMGCIPCQLAMVQPIEQSKEGA